MMRKLDFFRCMCCARLFERQEFTECRISACPSCGGRKFRRAGLLHWHEKIAHVLRRWKDRGAIWRGEYGV